MMLTLEGVTKSYSGRRVLDGLSFEIAAGESVAIIGANGSGKTTTLRCIAGLARAEAGRITIAGMDRRRMAAAAHQHVSYLPQRPAFPATATVRETLDVIARLRRLSPRAVDRELDACAIAHVTDRRVGGLSGGERQRLALAVALLPDVDLYLFDEPSASLDPAASRILFNRAAQLTQDGRTLLFTTHVPADVRHLATRVLLLGDGRIAAEAIGAFERRRYERMLAGFTWSDDHEDSMPDDGDCSRLGAVCGRLYDFPRAAAAADRSR
jgi:ABC-type multidrug transport system ATPase subunit